MHASQMITIDSYGKTKHLESFFKRSRQKEFVNYLDRFGQMGVEALALETPKDTGVTAASWNYEIVEDDGAISLYWTNSSGADRIPIVILIQYGHATRNGGYVAPYDFINPVTKHIFELIADTIWKEVSRK